MPLLRCPALVRYAAPYFHTLILIQFPFCALNILASSLVRCCWQWRICCCACYLTQAQPTNPHKLGMHIEYPICHHVRM